MTVLTFNGKSYDTANLSSGSNARGYAALTTAGTGAIVPYYIAIMVDAMADFAASRTTTSPTNVAIGSGTKTFVLAEDIPLSPGSYVLLLDQASPTVNRLFGTVTSYTSATKTLIISVAATDYDGSGTPSNWHVLGGIGPKGEPGAAVLDIASMTTTTVIEGADKLPIYDNSAGAERAILWSNVTADLDAAVASAEAAAASATNAAIAYAIALG